MKKILSMIKRLEEKGETLRTSEQKIIDAIEKLLVKNKYLSKLSSHIEDGDDECYIVTNDMEGVDYTIEVDLKEIGLDIPEEYLLQAIDQHFNDTGLHFDAKNKILSNSSGEEIFINHKGEIVFPTTERKNNFAKPKDDFHTWLLIEEWMEEAGNFPGVWNQDYNGGVSLHKFDENYSELFPQDSKAKLAKINVYLNLYKCKQELDEGYSWGLGDLADSVFEMLSQELKDLNYENQLTIHEVNDISFGSVTLDIECGDGIELKNTNAKLKDAKYGIYEVTVSLTPNTLRFIMTDEKPSGGILEMSLLPVG